MTTLREAAEKGLRALRVSRIVLMHPDSMAVADAAIAALEAALEQQEKKNPTRQMPEWIDYDSSTDVLTIHGRRYSAAMFGEQGFLSPVGTLLQVAEGQPDCVTLMTVPSKEQPEPEPVAWSVLDKRTKKHWYTNESKYTAQHYANECSHSQPDGSPSMVVTPLYTHPPRRVPEQEPVACAWHGDEDGTYETSCKHIFQMIDGTPHENNFTHCCFCGKSLVQHQWEDGNDE